MELHKQFEINLIILVMFVLFYSSCSNKRKIPDNELVIKIGQNYSRNKRDVEKRVSRYSRIFFRQNECTPNENEIIEFIEKIYIKPGLLVNHAIDNGFENDNLVIKRLAYARADLMTKTEGVLENETIYSKLKEASKIDLEQMNFLSNMRLSYIMFKVEEKQDINIIQKLVANDNSQLIQLYDINYFINKVKNRISLYTQSNSAISLLLTYPQINLINLKTNTWLTPFNSSGYWNLIYVLNVNNHDEKLEDEKAKKLFEILQIRKNENIFFKKY